MEEDCVGSQGRQWQWLELAYDGQRLKGMEVVLEAGVYNGL